MRLLVPLIAVTFAVACVHVDPVPPPLMAASAKAASSASAASPSPTATPPHSRASASPTSRPSASPAPKATPDPNCGVSTSDWCPAPPGDPCGAHKDTASCRADQRCVGMRYRGESFVACTFDARGFATNCPTVGCVSITR